jgi:hypothetical protein
MTSNIKRFWGGIGGIDTDSDDEVEIDTSATLTSGALDISYTEHVSKRQKQHHSTEWNHFGPTVEEHEGKPTRKQVCQMCFPPAITIATDLTNFYRVHP